MQCVYRFIDLEDSTVKYIGIVFGENRTLKQRTYEHVHYDEWCKNASWKVEYVEVNSRTDAESLESHFIALYNTGDFHNKYKANWGINSFLIDTPFQWKEYCQIHGGCVTETEGYPTQFIRVGIKWKHCDCSAVEIVEDIVFGRQDTNGVVCFNDGSAIRTTNIGKVFCSQYDLRGFCGETSMVVVDECARKPKLPRADMVSYCSNSVDIKAVKQLMLDIAASGVMQDCEMRKTRYENAYNAYQNTLALVNCLVSVKNSI